MKTLLCLLLFVSPSFGAEHMRHIAVVDFRNLTNDPSLDWVGTAVGQFIRVTIDQSHEFSPIERERLDETIKELKRERSELFDPVATQRIGKLLGADTLLMGTFQRSNDALRIIAQAVDVETGAIRAGAIADGSIANIVKLERDLAAKLMLEMKATLVEGPPPMENVEALHALSDGIYFYRNDFPKDALAKLDQALKLEPTYSDAHFYKGLVLEQMEQPDAAIAEFRSALPGAKREQRVKWSWEAPFTVDRSKRGMIVGTQTGEFSRQNTVWTPDALSRFQNRVIYGEHSGKSTTLHFVDLEQRAVRKVEIPDDKINFEDFAVSADQFTVVLSVDAGNMRIYAVGLNTGALLGRFEIRDFGQQPPMVGVAGNAPYVTSPAAGQLIVFHDRSLDVRFIREKLDIDRIDPPKARLTRANGEILIVKGRKAIQAIRLSDSRDAWTFTPQTSPFSSVVADHSMVVFEEKRVSIVDLETGKTRLEIPVAPYSDNQGIGEASIMLSAAKVEDGMLYFQSKTLELYTVELDHDVLWHTPIKQQIKSLRVADGHIYASAKNGDFLVLDAHSGQIQNTAKIGQELAINYAGPDVVVAVSEKSVFGLAPDTGKKRWEIPASPRKRLVDVVKGVVTARTSDTQLSAFDAETGSPLWQYSGKEAPGTLALMDSFFVTEENAIKEYAVESADERFASSNREVLTELANALLAKGNLTEAESIATRIAHDVDPDYAPLHALRARLAKSHGDVQLATHELAAYIALAGADSNAGKRAMEELKNTAHELLWRQPLDVDPVGPPVLVEDKLISVGRSIGLSKAIVALNPANGSILWRQITDRFSDTVIDEATKRMWMVTGDESDSKMVVLYSIALDSGLRKQLARWTRPSAVGMAAIAYAHDRLFIAASSIDPSTNRISLEIDGFTPDGTKLWTRENEGFFQLGLIAPEGETLVYSVGANLWTLNGSDGSVVSQHQEEGVIAEQILSKEPEALYYMTGKQQVVGYDVDFRANLNAVNFVVLGKKVFANNTKSIFALGGWRLPAAKDQSFLSLISVDNKLFAHRSDGTLLQLDPATGKILAEQPLLWPPSFFRIIDDRLYAFTGNHTVYALVIQPGKAAE